MSRKEPELESLDRQLRDAFQRADLPVAPTRLRADVESLASSTRSYASQPAHRRLGLVPRRTAVAALLTAAAAIAVVAVGLPVLLTQPQAGHSSPGDSRPTQLATSSPSSAPSATPSPSPSHEPVLTAADGSSITADGPSIAWTSLPLGQFGSNRVWAVGAAQVGTTMVVAANDSTQNDMKPVLIESTNGTDWSRVSTDGPEFAHARLDYLLRIPGGLLLVGESTLRDPLCAGGALGCNPVSAVLMWQSSDGQTWQPLPASALAPFSRVQIVSMAAGAQGLVAYGAREPVKGDPTFVALHSTDGTSWASSDFPDQNGGKTGVLVQNVAATPNGFVAIGSNDQVAGSAATVGGAAWYSPDGLTWTRAAAPAGSNDLILYAATGSAGIVATTNAIVPSSNQVWVSADGKTWRLAATSPLIGGSGWLAGDGNQILAISGPSVTWSNDGLTWHRGNSTPPMPSMSTTGMSGLAWVLGSTVVAVGPDGTTLYVGQVAGH